MEKEKRKRKQAWRTEDEYTDAYNQDADINEDEIEESYDYVENFDEDLDLELEQDYEDTYEEDPEENYQEDYDEDDEEIVEEKSSEQEKLDVAEISQEAKMARQNLNDEKKSYGKEKSKKTSKIFGGVAIAAVAIAGASYVFVGQKYTNRFYPKTTINGIDASGKTVEEVKALISEEINSFVLNLGERNDKTEKINGSDIELKPEFDGSLEELVGNQNMFLWLPHALKEDTYEISTMIQYNEDQLNEVMNHLDCFNQDMIEKPQDAYLSDYKSGTGFEVIPEFEGNELDETKAKALIKEALANLQESISFEENQCYIEPGKRADNEELNSEKDKMNQLVNTVITYKFGNKTEVLDGSTISTWIQKGEDGAYAINPDHVSTYVKSLAEKYDTAGKARPFKTSYGSTVSIKGGTYGWKINQQAEKEALMSDLLAGTSKEKEPEYSAKAASRGDFDYGNTYVEINLTAQHLYFYKDGKLVVESDFVSGNEAKKMATPAGSYSLSYKQRNATLKGQGYSTPVAYWMPFNRGIGMHDAKWRSSFGGNIYKTNGSHGCINLPASVAKTIFENIAAGIPVLCYHLEGTGSKTTTGAKQPAETQPAQTTSAETTAAQTKPTETKPTETKPTETQPAQTKPAETTAAVPAGPNSQSSAASGTLKPVEGQPGVVQNPGGNSGGPGSQNASSEATGSKGPGSN